MASWFDVLKRDVNEFVTTLATVRLSYSSASRSSGMCTAQFHARFAGLDASCRGLYSGT